MSTDTPSLEVPDLVARLTRHQSALGLPESEFSRRHLAISPSTWSRLQKGEYKLTPGTRIAEALASALRLLDGDAELGRALPERPVVATSKVRAVLSAVKLARRQPRDRLVVVLGKTGAGKSLGIARTLLQTYPRRALLVEATEVWRGSYFAAAAAFARAAGVKEDLMGATQAEARLLERLRKETPIVIIDEGHYFGPRTLNLVKAVLNLTPCVVVLLAIPSLWRRMEQSNWEESEQLRSRTCARIEIASIDARDAAQFLAEQVPGAASLEGWPGVVERCRAAADRFGLYDTLTRIGEDVVEECDGHPTADAFDLAIANVEALRR